MEENAQVEEKQTKRKEERKDNPGHETELALVLNAINMRMDTQRELINERIADVKKSCEDKYNSLEKKVTLFFKISIGGSIAVLIAYTSLPPETIKILVITICSLFAK